MATLNPLGLLGHDDVEYPSLLLAAQQKAAAPASAPGQPKKAPAQAPGQPKKAPAQAQPAAKASTKLPSKPLPPSRAGLVSTLLQSALGCYWRNIEVQNITKGKCNCLKNDMSEKDEET